MRLIAVEQVDLGHLQTIHFDLVIAASGFEQRATYLAQELGPGIAETALAVGFRDRRTLARPENDRTFGSLGYDLIEADGDSEVGVKQPVLEHLKGGEDKPLLVLIDYSSMTRVWYAGLIAALRDFDSTREVIAYFAYTPAEYVPPQERGPNAHMGPIPGFSGLALPDQQIALVVGLGYEPHVAAGLVEYVEASETFAFLASPAVDPRYDAAVRVTNAVLLRKLGPQKIFTYPLGDIVTTGAMLTSACSGLEEDYRVMLAPLGPKPFTLACLLLASTQQRIDVWRVSAGSKAPTYEGVPIPRPIIARAVFRPSPQGADRLGRNRLAGALA